MFSDYVKSFAGLPIEQYEPGNPIPESDVAVRVGKSFDWPKTPGFREKWYLFYQKCCFCAKMLFHGKLSSIFQNSQPNLFDEFFQSDGLENVKTLVFGIWRDLGDLSSIIKLLIENASKLPNLKALFIGDVPWNDCEVSWLEINDASGLWKAFPKLEVFWLRGNNEMKLGEIRCENLREFVLQSGGLPQSVVDDVLQGVMPNLEHLELWFGDDFYGGDATIDTIEPILTGGLFPKLKYLGLKNAEFTDDIAKAIVNSPILPRLEVLDLSEGVLGDEGVEAILASPEKFAHLKKLDLHHHYMSDGMMQRMSQMPCPTDVSEQEEEEDEGDRFVSVSE